MSNDEIEQRKLQELSVTQQNIKFECHLTKSTTGNH